MVSDSVIGNMRKMQFQRMCRNSLSAIAENGKNICCLSPNDQGTIGAVIETFQVQKMAILSGMFSRNYKVLFHGVCALKRKAPRLATITPKRNLIYMRWQAKPQASF